MDPNTTHKKRPLSTRQRNGILSGFSHFCQSWPNIECWLGSYVMSQGPVLLRIPIALWFSRGSGSAYDYLPDLIPSQSSSTPSLLGSLLISATVLFLSFGSVNLIVLLIALIFGTPLTVIQ